MRWLCVALALCVLAVACSGEGGEPEGPPAGRLVLDLETTAFPHEGALLRLRVFAGDGKLADEQIVGAQLPESDEPLQRLEARIDVGDFRFTLDFWSCPEQGCRGLSEADQAVWTEFCAHEDTLGRPKTVWRRVTTDFSTCEVEPLHR